MSYSKYIKPKIGKNMNQLTTNNDTTNAIKQENTLFGYERTGLLLAFIFSLLIAITIDNINIITNIFILFHLLPRTS